MFDLRKIPMLRVLMPFLGGMLVENHANLGLGIIPVFILFTGLTLGSIGIYRWHGRKPSTLPWLNTPLLFMILGLAGMGTGILSRHRDPGLPEDCPVVVMGELGGPVRSSGLAYVFDLKLGILCTPDSTYLVSTRLKCHMSEPADSLFPAPGETWQFSGKLQGIRSNGNPGMPDYRAIMGRSNCWYRFYVSSSNPAAGFNRQVAVAERKIVPARIRHLVSEHWKGHADELSLLKAVCLGDRSSLSDDMRQAYADAGGMHLLAVSGLHVGLIWWVLQYLTGWMRLIFRGAREQSLSVMGILWFYAFVTGFSSSVCRAVTMFSFLSLSRMRGVRIHTLNVIFSSAFLLLAAEPLRLSDIGFQLSYVAITGIALLHPLISGMFRVKHPVLRWIWEAFSVSLAAQLSSAPLVIHYFHQLPLYSVLTSLIAIPMLSVLIAIFVCSVPFVAAGILEDFSSFLLVAAARIMNRSVEYLSSLPGAVMDQMEIGSRDLLLWFLGLILTVMGLHERRRLYFYLILFLLAIYITWNAVSALSYRSSSELVIAHIRGASHLSFRSGAYVDHYCWYGDSTSVDYMESFRSRLWKKRKGRIRVYVNGEPDRTSRGASSCMMLKENSWLLSAEGIQGLVLRGPNCQELALQLFMEQIPDAGLLPDFILLSGAPPLYLYRGEQFFDKVLLVVDGSNGRWYEKSLSDEWGNMYLTDLEGAYVKRW